MAQRTEQVIIVGPTSVQELLTKKTLLFPEKKTTYVFVPQVSKASQTSEVRPAKTIKLLKTFAEV